VAGFVEGGVVLAARCKVLSLFRVLRRAAFASQLALELEEIWFLPVRDRIVV
jgi:hypothetical protein